MGKDSTNKFRSFEDIAETLYAAYPRKVGREAALLAIRRALSRLDGKVPVSGKSPAEWLMERLDAFKKASDGNDRKFIPHCSTWFNQARYFDEDREWLAWKKKDGGEPVRTTNNRAKLLEELAEHRKLMASTAWGRMHEYYREGIAARVRELERETA